MKTRCVVVRYQPPHVVCYKKSPHVVSFSQPRDLGCYKSRYLVSYSGWLGLLVMMVCMGALAEGAGTNGAEVLLPAPGVGERISRPLRYRPDGMDFVIENGPEFFNRPLYCLNSSFRVDGGDKPEFSLYLPGRGGNLRLGLRTAKGAKWF